MMVLLFGRVLALVLVLMLFVNGRRCGQGRCHTRADDSLEWQCVVLVLVGGCSSLHNILH